MVCLSLPESIRLLLTASNDVIARCAVAKSHGHQVVIAVLFCEPVRVNAAHPVESFEQVVASNLRRTL